MTAISASSVSMKTMADGTLRISFDIEPINAQDAFKLFATPGTQVAIAALVDGSYLAQIPSNSTELKQQERMGDACYWTVVRCQEPLFWEFLESECPGQSIKNKFDAAELVKTVCGVDTRKELDTNPEANKYWNTDIREPYRLFVMAKGVPSA